MRSASRQKPADVKRRASYWHRQYGKGEKVDGIVTLYRQLLWFPYRLRPSAGVMSSLVVTAFMMPSHLVVVRYRSETPNTICRRSVSA